MKDLTSTRVWRERLYLTALVSIRKLTIRLVAVFALTLAAGCGESQQFVAIPPQFNRDAVPGIVIRMKAERFSFIPDTITARAGTLVHLEITAVDGTHGFQLGAFGIDERLDENETKSVEFYVQKKGTYGFRCSHICGIGHLGMTGVLIVE